jgi:hypothetical protein
MNQLIELQNEMNTKTKELLKNKEVFLTIKDYPNYAVSNLGRVKNLKKKQILKPSTDDKGYHAVGLSINGIVKTQKVHRLVANTFLSNIEKKPCVDHIDGDKSNNDLQNLRFATIMENNRNRRKQQKQSSSKYKGLYYCTTRNKYRVLIRIDRKLIHVGYFNNEEEAAEVYNQKARELFGEFANINIIINV